MKEIDEQTTKQKPDVSVIIPVHNRFELLKITLTNICSQSLKPKQIIVVNNNSSQDPNIVLKEFGDKILWVESNKKGPGAARNTGLEHATGKYIKFFDSDDLMTLNTLELQRNLLYSTNAPLIYSPYVHAKEIENKVWEQTSPILQAHPIPRFSTIHSCMRKSFFCIIPSFMFERNFLERLGSWREDITAYEDWDYLWRIGSLIKNPIHTDACTTLYRIHGLQTTGTHFSNLQRDQDGVLCLNTIIENEKNKVNSSLTIRLLKLKLLNILKSLKDLPEYQGQYKKLDTAAVRILKKILQIDNKINRIITQSDWQIMHGINKNPQAFRTICDRLYK